MKYRVCKNDGGYYKIQRLRKPLKLLVITILKEKWIDHGFYVNGFNAYTATFKTKELAEAQIKKFKEKELENNTDFYKKSGNWKCEGKIY